MANPETTKPFVHVMRSLVGCEHDFKGWRNFEDGTGGERVCSNCGLGAQEWSMHQGDIWEERKLRGR